MIMEKYLSLKEALESAKEGELIGFESVYDLTFEESYQYACRLTKDEEKAKELVREVYKEVYKDINRAPATGEFPEWVRFITDELAIQMYKIEPHQAAGEEKKYTLSEKQKTYLLMQIENQAHIFSKDAPQRAPWGLYKYRGFTKVIIIFDAILLAVIAAAFIVGFVKIHSIFSSYDEIETPFDNSAVESVISSEADDEGGQ